MLSQPSPPVDATDFPLSTPAKGSSERAGARDAPGPSRFPPLPPTSNGASASSTATDVQPLRPPSEFLSESERERDQPFRPPFLTTRSPSGAPSSTSMHPVSETETHLSFSSLGARTGTLGALSARTGSGAQVKLGLRAFNDSNAEAQRIAQLPQAQRASYAQVVVQNAATGNRPRARTGSTSIEDTQSDASVKEHRRREIYGHAMQVEFSHQEPDEPAFAIGSMEDQSGDVRVEKRSKHQRKKEREQKRLLAAGPNLTGNEASQGGSEQGSPPNVVKLPFDSSLQTRETRSHPRSDFAYIFSLRLFELIMFISTCTSI